MFPVGSKGTVLWISWHRTSVYPSAGHGTLSSVDRVRVAENHQAGLFISLHFNSSFPNTQAHGLETYCLTPCGMASTTTRVYADDTTATLAGPPRKWPNVASDTCNM